MNKPYLVFSGVFAALASILITAFLLWAALSHNTQCEFFCEGEIDWSYILQFSLLNLAVLFVPIFCLSALVGWFFGRRSGY